MRLEGSHAETQPERLVHVEISHPLVLADAATVKLLEGAGQGLGFEIYAYHWV